MHTIRLFCLLLSATPVVAESDYMKPFSGLVCGWDVAFEYSTSTTGPSVMKRSVVSEDLRKPGDLADFVNLMYDYRRAWHASPDGSVIVEARVMRRSLRRVREGVSYLDVDRLIQSMEESAPHLPSQQVSYGKVLRQGRPWIERKIVRDTQPGHGRNLSLEWLVPLSGDELLVFRVAIADYDTAKSASDASWYQQAVDLQERIFRSVKVTRPLQGN